MTGSLTTRLVPWTCVLLLAAPAHQAPSQPAAGPPVMSSPPIADGVAHSWRTVTIGAPFEGMLLEVSVREGDRMTDGAPIARMDDRVAEASLRAAEHAARRTADITHAEAEMELARLTLDRIEHTARESSASAHELDTARLALRQAAAQLEDARERQVQAELDAAVQRSRLAQHRMSAPFAGEVVRVIAETGSALRVAEPVAVLADRSILEVQLHLPAMYWKSVRRNADLTLDAGPPLNATLLGRVTHVSDAIDAATSLIRVVVQIDNSDLELPSGFVVRLQKLPVIRQASVTDGAQ